MKSSASTRLENKFNLYSNIIESSLITWAFDEIQNHIVLTEQQIQGMIKTFIKKALGQMTSTDHNQFWKGV